MAVATHSIKKIIVNIDFISWPISNFLVIFSHKRREMKRREPFQGVKYRQ